MRKLIWIGLLITVVATLRGQSGKGTQAPANALFASKCSF
jgi:hypothetical protein